MSQDTNSMSIQGKHRQAQDRHRERNGTEEKEVWKVQATLQQR